MTPGDPVSVGSRPAFGDDRSRWLGLLLERAAAALGVRAGDGLAGYALVMPTLALAARLI